MTKLRLGQVVQLNSGSPPMTIGKIRNDCYENRGVPSATVYWFQEVGEQFVLNQQTVPLAALHLVEASKEVIHYNWVHQPTEEELGPEPVPEVPPAVHNPQDDEPMEDPDIPF